MNLKTKATRYKVLFFCSCFCLLNRYKRQNAFLLLILSLMKKPVCNDVLWPSGPLLGFMGASIKKCVAIYGKQVKNRL